MENRVPAGLSTAEARKFGLLVGGAFLALAAISWWRGHPTTVRVTGGLGGALVVLGAVAPGVLGPVYKAWMGLAGILSKVTTPIFMGATYLVVLTPIALLRRTFGGNPMAKPAEPDGSYWRPRSGGAHDPASMERPF
jgi:hypothetical protein